MTTNHKVKAINFSTEGGVNQITLFRRSVWLLKKLILILNKISLFFECSENKLLPTIIFPKFSSLKQTLKCRSFTLWFGQNNIPLPIICLKKARTRPRGGQSMQVLSLQKGIRYCFSLVMYDFVVMFFTQQNFH